MKLFTLRGYYILALLLICHPFISNAQDSAYGEKEVKKTEAFLAGLHGNVDKIKTLLKLSDWYESNLLHPEALAKAFGYANDALLLSKSLHSTIYEGKSYLQLSMLYQLNNDNKMIEVSARKAIALFTKTSQTDDLAESWVMVWSAKMRNQKPLTDRLVPIQKASALFKQSGNNKRNGDCYKEMSELYYSFSDYENSLSSLKKALFFYKAAKLKDRDIYLISHRLNILYETDKKNKDIIRLKNETTAQQNKLKSAAILRNSMITCLVLLLIILALLYKSFMFKKKTNKVLETQQGEINQKNSKLEHMVSEKEWLLREIHHRVKNNLHMVVGLLASQSEFLKGEEALKAISNSQHRIQSMSLIHQKLYQSKNLSTISMPAYILELTEYLKDSFGLNKFIKFRLTIQDIEIPLSHSIPIGLIINEAVTNSFKYAFKEDGEWIIEIYLKLEPESKYKLCIHDNGVGLPKGFDTETHQSLGIRLMKGLSDDIHAEFKIENDKGTKITILFSINEIIPE